MRVNAGICSGFRITTECFQLLLSRDVDHCPAPESGLDLLGSIERGERGVVVVLILKLKKLYDFSSDPLETLK